MYICRFQQGNPIQACKLNCNFEQQGTKHLWTSIAMSSPSPFTNSHDVKKNVSANSQQRARDEHSSKGQRQLINVRSNFRDNATVRVDDVPGVTEGKDGCMTSSDMRCSSPSQMQCNCTINENMKRREGHGQGRGYGERVPNATYWAAELTSFCHEATIVGLRHLVRPSSSRFRPVAWFLLITGGILFTIYQSGDRISAYLSWPTDVGVRVEYVDIMRFPTVIVCNENRVSKRFVDTLRKLHPSHYVLLVIVRNGL